MKNIKDNSSSKQAFDDINVNPNNAKYQYEQYIRRYPSDYFAYTHYAEVLIALGKYDAAEELLNYVEKIYVLDERFISDNLRVQAFKQRITISRFKLLSYTEKYDKLYELYLDSNAVKMNNKSIDNLFIYCNKKLGKLNLDRDRKQQYMFKQIIEYKEKDFINHSRKHLFFVNQKLKTPNNSVFSPNFQFGLALEEIKKYIPSKKALFSRFYEDLYTFKYDECGIDKGNTTDYFKVICFHNSNKFITMFPCSEGRELEYVDLNYLIPNDDNIKIKKLSRIERFNMRYGESIYNK